MRNIWFFTLSFVTCAAIYGTKASATTSNEDTRCNAMANGFIAGEVENCRINDSGTAILNNKEGRLVTITTQSSGSFEIWWPYNREISGSRTVCSPLKADSCPVMVRINGTNGNYVNARIVNGQSACGRKNDKSCFIAETGAFAGLITWINPSDPETKVESRSSTNSASQSTQVQTRPLRPRKNADLGPAFTTTGIDRSFKRVPKYHQAVIRTMRGGRNYFGHGIVRMQVLSYGGEGTSEYLFWISVNCYTREWKFVENPARLFGDTVASFGIVQTNRMGAWACKRYGFSY
jgi:hypothetical protein